MSIRSSLAAVLLAFTVSTGSVSAASDPTEADFTPNPRSHSVAIDWVEVMLTAIERNPPFPTATTWRMWVVLSSMYDAWAAYDEDAIATASGTGFRRPASERTPAARAAAVSYAAHSALSHVFPRQSALFDGVLALRGLRPSTSLDPSGPDGIGNIAAAQVIRSRSIHGASAHDFEDVVSDVFPELYEPVRDGDPNRWVPLHVPTGALTDERGIAIASDADPSSYQVQTFLTPHWGSVEPFALASGHELRPPAPPQLGSDAPYTDARGVTSSHDTAYRAQTEAVLRISGRLTDEQKVIAEFWADGPHTWTPPGHWVQLAVGISLRYRHSLEEDVCMFMVLAGALLDAGIAAWDAKRAYDYVRPATAVPHLFAAQEVLAWAGPNLGSRLIDGADWRPYQSSTFVTPPFAEYVSGHSAFSAAAAEVLTAYTGSERLYDGVTRLGRDYDGDGVEDLLGQHVATPGSLIFEQGPSDVVVLRWQTFRDAADEAGMSRLYGGIHFQDGDLRGRELGREVGRRALAHAVEMWDPPPAA